MLSVKSSKKRKNTSESVNNNKFEQEIQTANYSETRGAEKRKTADSDAAEFA
jgi:hypothetical protein